MNEQIPITDRAGELATVVIERAAKHLASDGGFMAMALVESRTTPVIPPELEGEPRPGRGYLPVLAQDPGPLRDAIREKKDDLTGYAIVANATLRSPDGKHQMDAIVVEVGVLGEKVAHVIAQPYQLGEKAGFTGPPGILDTMDNLLGEPQPGAKLILE